MCFVHVGVYRWLDARGSSGPFCFGLFLSVTQSGQVLYSNLTPLSSLMVRRRGLYFTWLSLLDFARL